MSDTLLRRTALTDGTLSLAFAAPVIAFATQLSGPLGLSSSFLTAAGWTIVPFALLFLHIARTGSRPIAAIGASGNAVWVVLSFVSIPILQPAPLGAALIAGQAVMVAAFGWFQFQGLKRARPATA